MTQRKSKQKVEQKPEEKKDLPKKNHYSVQEIADFLGFDERTVHAWRERGLCDMIQPAGAGGAFRVPHKELLRLQGLSTVE